MLKFNKVLLVDDDEVSNFINTQVLSDVNLADEIMIAMNGQEALDMLNQCARRHTSQDTTCCPDLIFLDLNMPVMNGFEFLQACEYCRKKKISIVILTSSSNQKDVETAHQFPQVKCYLNKPLTADKVQKALQQI